jgi:predicted nucleic acid-binding protein
MTRHFAFWDVSSFVPLCVVQQHTQRAFSFLRNYRPVVWWATPVEITSALVRLLREGAITPGSYSKARQQVERYADFWRVVTPSNEILVGARSVLERFPLRAADALQLAAAMGWCGGKPRRRLFLTFDERLGEAAQSVGFTLG